MQSWSPQWRKVTWSGRASTSEKGFCFLLFSSLPQVTASTVCKPPFIPGAGSFPQGTRISLEQSLKYITLWKEILTCCLFALFANALEWSKPLYNYTRKGWVCVLPQWEGWGRLCASLGNYSPCFGGALGRSLNRLCDWGNSWGVEKGTSPWAHSLGGGRAKPAGHFILIPLNWP